MTWKAGMSRGHSWRTGSPDRLNAFLENQEWDPVLMFGGRRVVDAPRAPAPPPAPSLPAAPQIATTITGFTPPEWCAPPKAANFQLLVWRGAALVETVPLGCRAFLLAGRLQECEIVLEHASASRQHAVVLQHRSGAIYVLDLGSAHGTFLDGRRLPPREPAHWPEGGALVFGASSRCYVLRALNTTAPLAPPPSIIGAPATPASAASQSAPRHPPSTVHATSPSEGDDCAISIGDDDERDEWPSVYDEELEANTWRNVHIPVVAPVDERAGGGPAAASHARHDADEARVHRERAKLGKRLLAASERSVTFDTRPPQVRYFEPASPERISDPELATAPAGGVTKAVHAAGGGACSSVAPTSLPKPKCTVSIVSASQAKAKRAREDGSGGQFAHLVASLQEPPASTNTTTASAGLQSRLAELYGSNAVDAAGGDVTTTHATAKATMEREEGALLRRARAQTTASSTSPTVRSRSCTMWANEPCVLDCRIESQCTHTHTVSLVADGPTITLEAAGGGPAPLLSVHFEVADRNPMSDGRVPVRYRADGSAASVVAEVVDGVRVGTASAPARPTSAGSHAAGSGGGGSGVGGGSGSGGGSSGGEHGGSATLTLSIVNPQPHPILVYVGLRLNDEQRDGAAAHEVALTPWEGAAPPDELPQPLSAAATSRGTNCLLLAPCEGTAQCVADDAETAPFGESNTFRFVAHTGAACPWPGRAQRAQLRIEASYQVAGGGGLLGADYEELVAEAPFVVATLPLS